MDSPQFLITDYLKNLNDTEEFRNTLFKKGIMTKYYRLVALSLLVVLVNRYPLVL